VSLRVRLTLAAAAAVAIAVLIVAAVSYVTVERKLVDELDRTLLAQSRFAGAQTFVGPGGPGLPQNPDGGPFKETRVGQLIYADGSVYRFQPDALPVDATDRAIARGAPGRQAQHFRDVTVDGTGMRMLTRSVQPGVAVQVAQPRTEVDHTLSTLRWILLLVAGIGIAVAAALGALVARAALRPVAKLTDAAEHVAETQDLGAEIEVDTRDELGRLATSFNAMLAALSASRQQQRQLVADAGHELRTPLTSLRTNIEVLSLQRSMPDEDRRQLLADVVTQLEELTVLVGDLVELARDDGMPQPEARVAVRLDEVVERAVTRARLHRPNLEIVVSPLEPGVVEAQPALLERAVANVIDNAGKWSPPAGRVEVALVGGTLTVRDHGPGIDPADLPHVFDRFYRAPAARSMPGSGLGLAIVRHAAEAHGGTVTAEPADGGGTRVRIHLPHVEPPGAIEPAAGGRGAAPA
jgi:two-component system sensor histidine kinase MprB